MLVPAISRKEDLLREFSRVIYSEGYFYYCGYAYCHELPKIEPQNNVFQWAVVNPKTDKVVGYIAYRIDAICDSVYNFGVYGFEKNNILLARDLFAKLDELILRHRRIEWRCVSNNPVLKDYQKFCKKHKGHEAVLHQCCKSLDGSFVDDHVFEILSDERFVIKPEDVMDIDFGFEGTDGDVW